MSHSLVVESRESGDEISRINGLDPAPSLLDLGQSPDCPGKMMNNTKWLTSIS